MKKTAFEVALEVALFAWGGEFVRRAARETLELSGKVEKNGTIGTLFGEGPILYVPSSVRIEGDSLVFDAPFKAKDAIDHFHKPRRVTENGEKVSPEREREIANESFFGFIHAALGKSLEDEGLSHLNGSLYSRTVHVVLPGGEACGTPDTHPDPLSWIEKRPKQGILDAVLSLANAKPERVLKFAENYGPLWICSHHSHAGLDYRFGPAWHFLHPVRSEGTIDEVKGGCRWNLREPIAAYKSLGVLAEALVGLYDMAKGYRKEPDEIQLGELLERIHTLDMGLPSAWDLWHHVFEWNCEVMHPLRLVKKGLDAWGGGLRNVAFRFMCLFLAGKLQPETARAVTRLVVPESGQPYFETTPGFGIDSALWFEMAELVFGAKRILRCSKCGNMYRREGKLPRQGESNYCPSCGRLRKPTGIRGGRLRGKDAPGKQKRPPKGS
ncbi:MAG: hypothetical protein ACC613_06820 [Synergistales bacterium]